MAWKFRCGSRLCVTIGASKVKLEKGLGFTKNTSVVINPEGAKSEVANIVSLHDFGADNTQLKLASALRYDHDVDETLAKRRHVAVHSGSVDHYKQLISKTQDLWQTEGLIARRNHALIAVESAPDDIPQMALTAANVDVLNKHAERHYHMLIWRLSETMEMELNAMVYHYLESRFLTDVRKKLSERIFELNDEELARGVSVETVQKENERDMLEERMAITEKALRELRVMHKRQLL